ncbi:ester cyclase [Leifsonia sp. NPDC014704]|uniref:ester cyclase n=1 Tax=Leifsonia sp. NPDC014704 TaxID=3364123 RepID=UPI0036F48409
MAEEVEREHRSKLTEAKGLVRRHFQEIWNDRRLDACDELMADDFFEHAPAPFSQTPPGRVHGPSAMRGTVAWLTGQFPDLRMDVEALIAEDDVVAARVVARGTFLGQTAGGPPPTGRSFEARQTHWFRVAGGQLVEHWATRDDLTTMIQTGIVRPPAGGPPA